MNILTQRLRMLGKRVASDESGNAGTSLVFTIFAIIVGGILATAAITIVQQSSASAAYGALKASMDQRTNDYITAVSTDAPYPQAKICYPDLGSCVTIVSTTTSGSLTTVEMTAVYGGQGLSLDEKRVLTRSTASHISGFSLSGAPVWVTVPGSPKLFTGFTG